MVKYKQSFIWWFVPTAIKFVPYPENVYPKFEQKRFDNFSIQIIPNVLKAPALIFSGKPNTKLDIFFYRNYNQSSKGTKTWSFP